MEEKKWENYINEVLSFVKFKYDHKAIRRELTEHMEDLREDLMAEGMDEAVAAYMTVAYMGDAAEIGKALDQEDHKGIGDPFDCGELYAPVSSGWRNGGRSVSKI